MRAGFSALVLHAAPTAWGKRQDLVPMVLRNQVLACAPATGTDLVVSDDAALLNLKQFLGMPRDAA